MRPAIRKARAGYVPDARLVRCEIRQTAVLTMIGIVVLAAVLVWLKATDFGYFPDEATTGLRLHAGPPAPRLSRSRRTGRCVKSRDGRLPQRLE